MAKSRSSSKAVSRLFDRAAAPVYLVSADHRVAYANDACAKWVGLDLETLNSCPCVFSSHELDDPAQNRIQGLCPPPALMAIHDQPNLLSLTFNVSAFNESGQKSWRSATASTLMDADQNHLGVLVVCSQIDLPESPSTDLVATGLESETLHAALTEIRSASDRIYSLETLVGTSPFANRLRRQVDAAIGSTSDLLIHGPGGSGKEHLARLIHGSRANRNSSELLPVHCSIADQRLIQQNIKDIVASRNVAASDPGQREQDWLLLLDVDLLGEAAQSELLGFFQLPDFPLRTIATATCSLVELASAGKYSIALAHHLSTATVELVPLALRQEDIPFLAQALLERDNYRRDRQLSGFSIGAMQKLIEFNWPENIDQLNRMIQVAAQTTTGTEISETDLPDDFHNALQAQRIGTASETNIKLDLYLNEIEQELVARALHQAKGNKTKAAKLLGISRPKLLRRINFFGIFTGDDDTPEGKNPEELDPSAFEELD